MWIHFQYLFSKSINLVKCHHFIKDDPISKNHISMRIPSIPIAFSYMYWAVPSASQGGIAVPGMG